MSEAGGPTTSGHKLVGIILSQPQLVDELLTGFLDLGVPGATVVESRGMGQIIRQEMPIFAGLAALFPETTGNRLILSVMPESLVDPVYELVGEVSAKVDQPRAAICFTLPVERFQAGGG